MKKKRLLSRLAKMLSFFFGSLHYEMPGFIKAAVNAIKHRKNEKDNAQPPETKRTPKSKLRVIIPLTILILVLIISVIVGKSMSNPDLITLRIQAPSPTPMRPNATINPLRLEFSGSVAPLHLIGQKVEEGISLDPGIEGTWTWIKDDLLAFMPLQDWPVGMTCRFSIDKTAIAKNSRLRSYSGSFETRAFNVDIRDLDFHIDPVDPDIKQVAGTISFNHPVDPESLAGKVVLIATRISEHEEVFTKREYAITLSYDEFFGKAYVLSEPLPVPEENVTMELRIQKGIRSSRGGSPSSKTAMREVYIPGLTSFISVNSVTQTVVRRDDYSMEQLIVVDTKGDTSVDDLAKYIDVWVLPKDKQEAPGTKAVENMHWRSPDQVGPEDIAKGTRLELQPGYGALKYMSLNSFGFRQPPGSYLFVRIRKGAPFYGGYFLPKEYTKVLHVEAFPKMLQIMQEGILLSSRGEKKLSVISQGISGAHIRIARVMDEQVQHLVTQSNGNLTNFYFQNYSFNEYNISEIFSENRKLAAKAPDEPNYFSIDAGKYVQQHGERRNGLFLVDIHEWDPGRDRVLSRMDQRLIIISNLGLIVKYEQGGNQRIFVQSISTGRPVERALVEVLGKNGLPVLSGYTDSAGQCVFSSLSGFKNEKEATAYVVQADGDMTFMPVSAYGRYLDYSDFDTYGEYASADPQSIKGFLFSDRGIYRPGDAINIGMILKTGEWKPAFEGVPLEVSISDARGAEIDRHLFSVNREGFEEYTFTTDETSPTGTYQVNLHRIHRGSRMEVIGSTTVKVEEFIPDTLLINSDFGIPTVRGWVHPKTLNARVSLRNLAGFPAAGHKVQATLSLTPGYMYFHSFRDYRFTDPLTRGKTWTEELPAQQTDEQGEAVFSLGLARFDAATYFVRFLADGFEKESGKSVHSESMVLVSPLDHMVGMKADGDLSYINRNTTREVSLVAIDPQLKPVNLSGLKYSVLRIEQVSVLTRHPNGTYAYESVEKEVPLASGAFTISEKGTVWKVPSENAGDYLFVLQDSSDAVLTQFRYSVIGQENLTRSLDRTAELQIKLNRDDFKTGEEIEIFVKAPYTGSGLITIEKEKVYASTWFSTDSTSFIRKITVPPDLEGNGYVNVTFSRSSDSHEIFMSPLSYGVAPFSVSRESREIKVSLTVPELSRSGRSLSVGYQTHRPAKILLYAVDEGILNVSKYSTPDPLSFFFKKQALQVRTAQVMDLVLPEFSVLESIAAMGGGAGFDAIAKNLNPFKRKREKPVVFWSGIMPTDGSKGSWKIDIPDYFDGTVRVMAIAITHDRIGIGEASAVVRNPFVLSPNVPLFAAPKDSFEVSLLVTNVKDNSGKDLPVQVTLTPSSHFQIENAAQNAKIDERSDHNFTFLVKTLDTPGSGELVFTVEGAGETVKRQTGISIRPATPYKNIVKTGVLRRERETLQVEREMYDAYSRRELNVSRLPLGLAGGLIDWLDDYPYGCSEQIVSACFPYLLIGDRDDFGLDSKKTQEKIAFAIRVLQSRQQADGNIGVWTALSRSDDFVTLWSMHFLTEAKDRGHVVPELLLRKGLGALRDICERRESGLHGLRLQAYAAYLLTRNEEITTTFITTIRSALDKTNTKWKSDLSAGYLAGAYALMQQKDEAETLIRELARDMRSAIDPWHFYSDFIRNSQILYLVSTHFPQLAGPVSPDLLESIYVHLSRMQPTTINAAMAIIAIDAYTRAVPGASNETIELFQTMQDGAKTEIEIPFTSFPSVSFSPAAVSLELRNKKKTPLFYQMIHAGYDISLPENPVNEDMELIMLIEDANGKPVSSAKMGDEVFIRIRIRGLKKRTVHNVAIVNLLPAGLESDATLVRTKQKGSLDPDYTDIREDRLVLFATVTDSVKDFVYPVRAVNRGEFIIPAQYAEAMYNPEIYSISSGGKFVIE